MLQRLPADYQTAETTEEILADSQSSQPVEVNALYERHEGGLLSRALGTAVHTLLEEFSRLRTTVEADEARADLGALLPNITAQIRARGLGLSEAQRIAQQALTLAENATQNEFGAWILSPHARAQSEASWTGWFQGKLRTVQADRIFQAGFEPLSEGQECWWIVDYKTTHSDANDPSTTLPALRELYRKQLETYAEVLRALHGEIILRAALFYPRMSLFDSWLIENGK